MRKYLLIGVVLVVGCKTKSNGKYCDTTCGDPSQICDQIKHECVPANSDLSGEIPDLLMHVDDLSMPGDLSGDDLSMPDMAKPPACVMSSTCPSPLPVCDSSSMACRLCSGASEDSVCSGRSAATPHCRLSGANMGQCVQCNVNTDCQASQNTPVAAPACDSTGACVPCHLHGECASGVCDLTNGMCVVPGDILYVDNVRCVGQTPDGSFGAPYCQIYDALPSVTATIKYIMVAGSTTAYGGNITISPPNTNGFTMEVHIVGPGKRASKVATVSTGGKIAITLKPIAMNQTLSVFLDGLVIAGDATHDAVYCDNGGQTGAVANLSARDCDLSNSKNGLEAQSGCSLTSDANIISQNDIGLELLGGSDYTIRNTIIAHNATRGVDFNSTVSKGGFSFNTIGVNGTTNDFGAMDCHLSPQLIVQSIVTENTTSGGTQFRNGGNCHLFNVVVANDNIASSGALNSTPVFVSDSITAPDLHLKIDDANSLSMNQACCIDKVSGAAPSPTPSPLPLFDYDLEKRPKGAAWDIGADEAM
jgi:hypothetical protein